MTRCNQGVLLDGTGRTRWPRWCQLPLGHKGRHKTRYLGEWLEFDGPDRGDDRWALPGNGGIG